MQMLVKSLKKKMEGKRTAEDLDSVQKNKDENESPPDDRVT